MKTLLIPFLLFCVNANGQNMKSGRLSNYFKPGANMTFSIYGKDTTIEEYYAAGRYVGWLMLNKEANFKYRDDTLYIKSKVKNETHLIVKLPTAICSLDTIKKRSDFKEDEFKQEIYKIAKYYSTSLPDGNFTLAIPVNTKHPLYFFSEGLVPIVFNYPAFKQSAIFRKIRQSKGWVKYLL
ncbi:hypothetical protein [Ferruginibacter sp.]